MAVVHGCRIKRVEQDECRQLIDAVGRRVATSARTAGMRWLLAHCDDGVEWGRRDADDEPWRLSSAAFPDISPPIGHVNVQQLRLFGPDAELLIWRVDDGFLGRRMADASPLDVGDPRRAAEETYVVLGDRRLEGPRDGFTLVGNAAGSRHAVPLECPDDDFKARHMPLRLRVRHYFEQNSETGVVRVAASRILTLEQETRA